MVWQIPMVDWSSPAQLQHPGLLILLVILQALLTCIKMPQSSLLSYTAMDKAETSDITRAIQHRAIRYQVSADEGSEQPHVILMLMPICT